MSKWLGALFLSGLFLMHCGTPAPKYPDAPIILITLDTLRSDRLPVYGYKAIATPAIDALAQDAVVFERAYAQVPLTLPSHAGIMTGLLPGANGVRDNLGFQLDADQTTLAERLKRRGYRTGAVVSSMVLRRSTGIEQGFDFYDDHLPMNSLSGISSYAERLGGASLAVTQRWLEEQPDGKFFLWLHLYDPHVPYNAPEPYHSQAADPYDGEILYVDHLMDELMGLLKEKGWYDPAIIALTSDHGEGFGEHGEAQHGLLIYRESIQVPLIVKLPGGARGGTRLSPPVGLIDICPTLLALTGDNPGGMDGRALFSTQTPPADRLIYSESLNPMLNFGWLALYGVIREDLHYIRSSDALLFDMIKDPGERRNLAGAQPIPAPMGAFLKDHGTGPSETITISEEDKALLASLGYTGSFNVDDSSKSLSERQFLDLFDLVGQSKAGLDRGEYSQVEQLLVPIVEKFPGLVDARIFLGHALVGQGKHEQAEYVYTEALALAPRNLSLSVALVATQLDLHKTDAAAKLIAATVKSSPKLGPRLLLPILDDRGLIAQAEPLARDLLAFEPDYAAAELILAKAAMARNDWESTDQILTSALAHNNATSDPQVYARIQFVKGDSLARRDRAEEAISAFQKAIQAEPDFERARSLLSILYFSSGDRVRALANLEAWTEAFPSLANLQKAEEVCRILGMEAEAMRFQSRLAQIQKDRP